MTHLEKLKEYANQLKASDTSSKFSGGTEGILQKERALASFDTEIMTNILDGDKKKTARKRFIRSPFDGKDFIYRYSLSRSEIFADAIKDFIEAHKKFPKIKPTPKDFGYMNQTISPGGSSIGNSMYIFQSTIFQQGDKEQQEFWHEKAIKMKLVGAYAQTELGHGSNVRGLQTTATYDKEAQQFILDTPTLQAIKWWPGALGKASTHACVYAQLIMEGKEYGLHVFMLQIRDENFKPLPGILLGDLGNKIGDPANDTGFMILDKVRIPRRFMLMGHSEVTSEGKYVKKSVNKQAHYQTMIITRAAMSASAGNRLAMASTIAARWSAIRRQGFVSSKSDVSYQSEERPILDYQIQQYRILKQISISYAIKFYAQFIVEMVANVDYANNMKQAKEFSAISAGMKSVLVKMSVDGIEDLRKSCGGAGYLLNSGIGNLMADYLWQVTAEGDYIILGLLTSKFLIKSVGATMTGKRQKGQMEYLNRVLEPEFSIETASPLSANSFTSYYSDLNYMESWFKYRALVYVLRAAQLFQTGITEQHKSVEQVTNEISMDLYNASWVHCQYFLFTSFYNKIKELQDQVYAKVLQRLLAFYACSNMQDDKWTDILPCDQMQFVKESTFKLMKDLRNEMIGLVDAFDITDTILASTIGRKDGIKFILFTFCKGNVYEAMYKAALESPLNQNDPFLGFDEALKPHLDTEFLKLKNKLPESKL